MNSGREHSQPGEFRIQRHSNDEAERLLRLRPYVRQSGDSWRSAWAIEERKLLDYLIVYIAQGNGLFAVAGKSFAVHKGDVIWIPPDTIHEMRGYPPKMHCPYVHFDLLYDPFRSHWDVFVPGGKRDLGDWRSLMHPPLKDPVIDFWCGKLPIANPAVIGSLLERICREHAQNFGAATLLLSGLMLQLIAELLRGTAQGDSLPLHWERMQSSLKAVQQNLVSPLSVEQRATEAGLSSSHFRKLFREIHGQSARTVRRQTLMQKARELLADSNLTVSEIASRLGFSTVHNFSRAFRSVAGVSPRKYRQGSIVKW